MKNAQKKQIHEERVGPPQKNGEQDYLVIEVAYSKPRTGYVLRAHIETRHPDGIVSFMLCGPAYEQNIAQEHAERFNARRLAQIIIPQDLVELARSRVLAQIGEKKS